MLPTSFGRLNRSIEENYFIGKYGELYYESALNLKQRHTNSFILKMVSKRWQVKDGNLKRSINELIEQDEREI